MWNPEILVVAGILAPFAAMAGLGRELRKINGTKLTRGFLVRVFCRTLYRTMLSLGVGFCLMQVVNDVFRLIGIVILTTLFPIREEAIIALLPPSLQAGYDESQNPRSDD